MKYLIVVLLIFTPSLFWAQAQKLDSLVIEYFETQEKDEKYNIALSIMEASSTMNVREAKELSQTLLRKGDKSRIFAYSIMADVFYYKNMLDSSLLYYLKAKDEAFIRGETKLGVSGMGNSSFVLREMGHGQKALTLARQALAISQKAGDPKEQADLHYNLNTYYYGIGMLDSSVFHLTKAMEFDRLSKNQKGMCANLVSMANLHLLQEKYNLAIQDCNECVGYAQELKNKYELSRCKAMLARVFLNIQDYTKANEIITEAISIETQRKDSSRLSNYIGLQAKIYDAWGRNKEAINIIDQSIEIAKHSKKNRILFKAMQSKASFLVRSRKTKQLESLIVSMAKLNDEYDLKQQQSLIEIRKELALLKGDYKAAYNLLQSKNRHENTASANQLNNPISRSEDILEMYALEKENKLLEAQKQSLESRSQLMKLLFFSGLLLSLLSALLVYFWAQTQKRKRQIEKQAAIDEKNKLENALLNKELSALRAQMNPHFLFNSLSSINDYIMHEDARTASKYLTKFSHLMRKILNNSKAKVITLSSELEALKLYVELENLRLNGKIDYSCKVAASMDEEQVYIPSLLIQPYVENCIKHGIAPKSSKGKIEIEIKDLDSHLEIIILDDGIGREEAMKRKRAISTFEEKSLGMSITKDRLELINSTLKIESSVRIVDLQNPTGTKVILKLKKIQKPLEI